jgi:hypothetical protein
MRIIKLAIISFVMLFLLVTVISLFIPSKITISKATRMRATKEKVMEQVADPTQWKNWFPGMDTLPVLYTNGKATGIILNEKEQRHLSVTGQTDLSVNAEYFGIDKKVTTGWNILPGATTDSVSVQWQMQFRLRWYPWEKFSSLLFEKQYGIQMEMGLKALKDKLEK